jgi:hypothetical protein
MRSQETFLAVSSLTRGTHKTLRDPCQQLDDIQNALSFFFRALIQTGLLFLSYYAPNIAMIVAERDMSLGYSTMKIDSLG